MKNLLTRSLYLGLFFLLLVIGPHSQAKRTQPPAWTAEDPQSVAGQETQSRPAEMRENTKSQLYELMLEKQSRTPVQQKIDSQLLMAVKMKRHQEVAPGIATMKTDVAYDSEGRAEVDISGEVTGNLFETILKGGGQVANSYPQFKAVRAYVPLESLESIADLSEVRFISRAAEAELSSANRAVTSHERTPFEKRAQRIQQQLLAALPQGTSTSSVTSNTSVAAAPSATPTPAVKSSWEVKSNPPPTSAPPVTSNSTPTSTSQHAPFTGSVTSEGDVTHTADQARTSFGVTGTGIKIGVISDSVDYLAQSQANGNLPAVTVLSGRSGVPATGEGTAMLEIIYDLAPGAQLFFSTGYGGPAAFAQNILDLRAAGCNIIVDDLEYFNESPFQDAVIAQAVNTVTAGGALYFSSAGNSGNWNDSTSSVWEGDFVDGGTISINGTPVGNAHRFTTPNVILNPASSNNSHGESCYLFWSDPLAGSANDYDLYIVNSSGTIVRMSNTTQNGTQDPIENVSIADGEQVLVVKFSGANRYLHVNVGRGTLLYKSAGRTKGHSAAADAFSVAAVKARTSYPNPFTGGAANPVETFSSDGPRRLFYTANGTPITPGNLSATGGTVRAKPDIAAADAVSTSVPGFGTFTGTSAAAPHAAAIAGLIWSSNPSLTPAQVRTAMTSTALDIEDTGSDRDSGAGIVMAKRAVQVVATCPATPISPGQTINGSLTTSDCVFTNTTKRVDVYNFSGIPGQQVSISMSSSAFDTFLYLLDADSNTLAFDDDGGGGTNSRIPTNGGFFTIPATGTYTIYATSFSEGSTGAYTLSLSSSNCSFSLNPTHQIFISSASTGSFTVSTQANCPWTAVSDVSWLTTSSTGIGNGTVNYSVAANSGNSRTGNITVQGQNFAVFQSAGNGSGCPSTTIVPGQTISATLTTGCVFTGTSRYVDPYNFSGTAGQQIAIAMSSSAFDTYLFLDDPNGNTIARDDDGGGGTNSRIPANAGFFTLSTSGTYRIFATSYSADGMTGSTGPYTISLSNPTTCSYSINPTSQSAGAAGGSSSFSITAPAGCNWTALSNASWITTSSSGSGNGTINYSVAANTGVARVGTISVGGKLFTVNQSEGSGPLRIDSISPLAGRTSGGQLVRLTGSFAGLSSLKLGGISASWFYTNGSSDTTAITVTTPAHAVGAVQIDLTPTTGSVVSKANAFAYLPTVFTDDTLTVGQTTAKAQHILELRQAVDAMRAVAGLSGAPWTDPGLAASGTIKAAHILDLRTFLNDAATRLGYPTSGYTDPSLTTGFTIKRVHIEELRQRLRVIAGLG